MDKGGQEWAASSIRRVGAIHHEAANTVTRYKSLFAMTSITEEPLRLFIFLPLPPSLVIYANDECRRNESVERGREVITTDRNPSQFFALPICIQHLQHFSSRQKFSIYRKRFQRLSRCADFPRANIPTIVVGVPNLENVHDPIRGTRRQRVRENRGWPFPQHTRRYQESLWPFSHRWA